MPYLDQCENREKYTERQRLRLSRLETLLHYPAGERFITALAKVFMAILIGGSTVIAFVIFGTTLSIAMVIGFAIGGVVYSIKALRDIRKKRATELRLTNELLEKIEALRALFAGTHASRNYLFSLDALVALVQADDLDEEKTERLYTYLCELRQAIDITIPDHNGIGVFSDAVDRGLDRVERKIRALRELDTSEPCLPIPEYGAIRFKPEFPPRKPFSVGRACRKAGNRTLSFVGGASAAAGIGVVVAALAFGVTTPTGWVLATILGVSCVVGLMAVGVDYYLSRREDKKIKQLEEKCDRIDDFIYDIKRQKRMIHRMSANATLAKKQREKDRVKEQKINTLMWQNAHLRNQISFMEGRVARDDMDLGVEGLNLARAHPTNGLRPY